MIVSPRLDTSTIAFKICVAISALTLLATAVLGVYTYFKFNMGDPTEFEAHAVYYSFDLKLPDGEPLTINSTQDDNGTWVYVVPVIDPATGEEKQNLVPANLTNFLDPSADGRCFMEWTETYVTYHDVIYRDAATMELGLRNEDEMEAAAANLIVKPNCVVYIPRGTIVNHPPEPAPEETPAEELLAEEAAE